MEAGDIHIEEARLDIIPHTRVLSELLKYPKQKPYCKVTVVSKVAVYFARSEVVVDMQNIVAVNKVVPE